MAGNCGCSDGTIKYEIGNVSKSPQEIIADVQTEHGITLPEDFLNQTLVLALPHCSPINLTEKGIQYYGGPYNNVVLCIPIPYYNNPLSEEERVRTQQAANELIEDREADRTKKPPLTQEQVDRLSAEIATAEHYAELLDSVASDPTALLAEELLLPGQELSEEVSEEAHKKWLRRYIITHRLGLKPNMSTEDMENKVRESLISNHIEGLIAYILEICQRNNSHEICWEMTHGDYIESLKSMSLEALFGEILSLTETIHEMIGQVPDDFYQSDLVSSYYDTIDQAQIEAILEEWNQEAERALLAELLIAISEIPPSILGVDVGFVKTGVLDYYGQMEARHQILAGILAQQMAVEAQREAQDTEARTYYIGILGDDTEGDFIDPEWLDLSTDELKIKAKQIAYENSSEQDGAYRDFFARYDEIYGTDSYAHLKGAVNAAMLVLSFVPIIDTGIDIIDALWAISRRDYLSAGLSLIGPIGDVGRAVGRIAGLFSAGDNAADALRAMGGAIDTLEDSPVKTFILRGRDAVDEDNIVSELRWVHGEMASGLDKIDEVASTARTTGKAIPTGHPLYDSTVGDIRDRQIYKDWEQYMLSGPSAIVPPEDISKPILMFNYNNAEAAIGLGTDGRLSIYITDDTRYLALLHEQEHMPQWSRILSDEDSARALNNLTKQQTDLVEDFMEVEPRLFEFYLGLREGFDIEAITNSRTWINNMTDSVSTPGFADLYQTNPNFRLVIDTIITDDYYNDPVLRELINSIGSK